MERRKSERYQRAATVSSTSPLIVPTVEREFLFAVRRAGRYPHGRMALVLHLSRLPASQPHHHRIARSMLQDAAQRLEGQLFALQGDDLALLCRGSSLPSDLTRSMSSDPRMLPQMLGRLFNVPPANLVTLWDLGRDYQKLITYAEERAAAAGAAANAPATPGPAAVVNAMGAPAAIDVITNVVAGTRITDLTHRQTAVRLQSNGRVVEPLFRKVMFSMAALQTRIALQSPGQDLGERGALSNVQSDPFLFRHLATRLDQRMLDALIQDIGRGSKLDVIGETANGLPLHLSLTLAAVRTDQFAELVAACRRADARLGIEVAFVEAASDPQLYQLARGMTREAGIALVLDDITPLTLTMTRPWQLAGEAPDLIKLDWVAPQPGEPGAATALVRRALEQIGPHRIVLQKVDADAGLGWGLAHGIERFQGRQLDAMLAAGRMLVCPASGGCNLRQCIERGSAINAAGRVGCRNIALLDGRRSLSLIAQPVHA
jgi:hypothetical protein